MVMVNGSEKRKILIVDDVPSNIRILVEELRSEYEIVVATSGKLALQRAVTNTPDLILLDIMMPEMDGYEVCARLKEDRKLSGIPIIFVTAKDEEEDETKGLHIGAVDYITKPFSLPIVKARVKTHLELKQHRDFLENLSSLDGLTGIFNRRRFDETLQKEWERAARESAELGLIMMDLDCFKAYNDNYGHLLGDGCLRLVAKALKASLRRPADMVARYGGEEFAAILPRTDAAGAENVAERMRANIESLQIEHRYSTVKPVITASLGIAVMTPAPLSESRILINASDKALYEAKNSGKNQVKMVGV